MAAKIIVRDMRKLQLDPKSHLLTVSQLNFITLVALLSRCSLRSPLLRVLCVTFCSSSDAKAALRRGEHSQPISLCAWSRSAGLQRARFSTGLHRAVLAQYVATFLHFKARLLLAGSLRKKIGATDGSKSLPRSWK